jgi:adenosine deaminase
VALGVYDKQEDVPLRTLWDAGVPMALGADDPLLFGSRLAAQYQIAREAHGFTDAELAELARQSLRATSAPRETLAGLLAEVDDWLAARTA